MTSGDASISVDKGILVGAINDGVLSCLGVPYAAAPVGPLRFRSPVAHPGWDKPLRATSFASQAVQTPLNPNSPLADPGSEDCLYLNVWAPVEDGPHPVMFWVHGGAFVSGSADQCDGTALAQAGLVVVAPNYRLGPFGYLYLEEVAPGASDTNLAIRDLACALDWTLRNIVTFGGDPTRIALAGQSSGAMTVGSLMTSPLVRGKFTAAWMMSGAARQVRTKTMATESAEMFLAATGVPDVTASDIVTMPTETLVKASGALAQFSQVDDRFDAEVLLPVVGDDVLPDHPMTAIRRGDLADVELVVTWALADMELFRIFDAEAGGRNKELFARRLIGDDKWDELLRIYEATGPSAYSDLLTDFHFSVPARRLAEAQIAGGGRSWVGRFDRAPITPPWPSYGPVHTCDLFYLFTPLRPPSEPFSEVGPGIGMLDEDRSLAEHTRRLMKCVAQGEARLDQCGWPLYDGDYRRTLLFDEPLEVALDPDKVRRRAWEGLLEEF